MSKDNGNGNEEITSILKNSMEKIVIGLNRYQGRKYLDLRIFAINRQGMAYPTQKSFSIPVHLYPAFREALLEVDQFLINCGLMKSELE